jgi:hypothetical protein
VDLFQEIRVLMHSESEANNKRLAEILASTDNCGNPLCLICFPSPTSGPWRPTQTAIAEFDPTRA